jgi:hypothetical protein
MESALYYLRLRILPPHTRIVILLVDEEALQKAEHSLRQVGLTPQFTGQRRISEGPIWWNMILIKTDEAN